MMERLKSIGSVSLGIFGFLAMLAIPFLFFKGAIWASENLLRLLMLIGFIVPGAGCCGAASPFLGPSVASPHRWPHLPVVVSLRLGDVALWLRRDVFALERLCGRDWPAFFDVGVVFMAILASTFKAMWELLAAVIVLAIITNGSRLAGLAIGGSDSQ